MKVTFTSVVWQEVYDKITELNEMFSEVIAPKFRDKSFGKVDEFIFALVSVGSAEENNAFGAKHNKVGTYKDYRSNEKIRFISLAIKFSPSEIGDKTLPELKKLYCNALSMKLQSPNIRIPKDFDMKGFSKDLDYILLNNLGLLKND